MKISEIFNLNKSQNELDFVDVNIKKDKLLFIDPYRMSKLSGQFITEANGVIHNYFSYLIELIKNNKIDEAESIFTNLGEVNETCLGFSRGKPRGSGLGTKKTKKIFTSLKNSNAIKYEVLNSLEDLRIFVDGVDKDGVSDMTTNIIRRLLITYTQQQCEIHNIPLKKNVASGLFWNPNTRSWDQEYCDQLVINNKKYLLVPKIIVSYGDRMCSREFFEQDVLDFFQYENKKNHTSIVQERKGKKNKGELFVTKKDIKERQLKITENNNPINKNWLTNFTNAHGDVFKKFKKECYDRMKELNQNENRAEIATYLIDKLKSIKPGNKTANEYHITMLCILEFIFYPNVISPKKEAEINQGRKRIDILYNNTSTKGYFTDLFEKHNIQAGFIMVECKNYTNDISNPELDQLMGRFSNRRGRFGISTSRNVEGENILMNRCADIYKDGNGLIIPLFDKDIIKILDAIKDGDELMGEAILLEKHTKIASI